MLENDNDLFQIDTNGNDKFDRNLRVRYGKVEDLEIENDELESKPSQDRPAILKMKTIRYHQENTNSKFKAGKITRDLRKALGLNRKELPEYIYRMRVMGYPVGWLKKCEIHEESLNIVGADNVIISGTNESNNQVKYDIDELIEYPGFNSNYGYDSEYDYSLHKGHKQMDVSHSLELFKQRLQYNHMNGKKIVDIKDMSQRKNVDSKRDFNLPRASRDVLDEFVKPHKRRKLAEDQLSDGEIAESEDDMAISDGEEHEDCKEQSLAIDEESGINEEELHEEVSTIVFVDDKCKPDLGIWGEGINDHRLFENLPNTGGTYKKVLEALSKNKENN